MSATFKRNLLVGFGVSLALLVISSTASFISIRNLLYSYEQVEHTTKIMVKLERIISFMKDAETGQRGYLLTTREVFLEPYNGAFDSARAELKEVKELTKDNPEQGANCNKLSELVTLRLEQLATVIRVKQATNTLDLSELDKGKMYMDQARAIIKEMTAHEQELLVKRTEKMQRFAAYTPVLIVLAALLSLIVAVVFFMRINNDFKRRLALQKALQDKDEDITRRINIIEGVAERISSGDYSVRTADTGKDGLGNLSGSLNKMASSLEHSFRLLSDNEWLQKGVADLNTTMIGELELNQLSIRVMNFIADYTGSLAGALYLKAGDDSLTLVSGYALDEKSVAKRIHPGEGLAGQAVLKKDVIQLNDIEESGIVISHVLGTLKPVSIVAVPIFFEHAVTGVLELASLQNYTANDIAFLRTIAPAVGTVINGVENRKKLQELLEETQAQAEELLVQHNELESINEELEAQSQKLQASEEELKVQQEELMQANQELEEKARLLEERNQLIHERNHEIQAKAEQLALSTKYKSEFLANMSHELRTPLNSILLLSRLMGENNETNLTDEQVEYARVIQSSGEGLLALINEILDLSKIEAGKMELQMEEVNLKEIAGGLYGLFSPLAKEKNIALQIQVAANLPTNIYTDRMRLEQILKNLLSNAIKFTSQGSVNMDINAEGKLVHFKVTDTGIGVSKEKQQLIFEAFQQADGSTRRKYGGTGLGLSISRELAKLLGGEITIESEEGKGSVFTVSIPMNVQDVGATEMPAETSPEVTYAPEPQVVEQRQKYISTDIPADVPDDRAAIQPKDKVILIIEDDTNFAKSLLEFAHQRGYKGIVCVRGDEALKMAKQYKPEGILLDIQLPIKDGLEVMDELKQDTATRHIPVHIMSSHEAKHKSLSKGAVDFISKPVAFDKIKEVFEKLEYVLKENPQKVLIVEENTKHAKALAYFLETYDVKAEIRGNIEAGIKALQQQEVNCVILDMGIPAQKGYDILEEVKKTKGLEHLPIIVFTGKSLSRNEEMRIRQYADSIVVKTAYSYQRIIDEVSLFLHLVEENNKKEDKPYLKKLGALNDVLKGKTVLVADDDVRNIYSLARALEKFDMNVVSAMDGKDALAKLAATPKVDIILMDMMMPEMDGYETTQAIKKDARYRKIPVIAVTAKAMVGDREKCIKAGASDYITKPVDVDQLLSLLRVWLYEGSLAE